MLLSNAPILDDDRYRFMDTGTQILDLLEERFQSMGATSFLVTGIPLPGRPLAPLILRASWGEYTGERAESLNIPQSDAVFRAALRARRPFEWPTHSDELRDESILVSLAGHPDEVRLYGVPVNDFAPYQAVVLGAGPDFVLDSKAMLELDYLCTEAFARLLDLSFFRRERPGDLSARERRVVELSAMGKTAKDIAGILKISQRTVHAHLQNACDKMRATNKTQTVVEAIHFNQIDI